MTSFVVIFVTAGRGQQPAGLPPQSRRRDTAVATDTRRAPAIGASKRDAAAAGLALALVAKVVDHDLVALGHAAADGGPRVDGAQAGKLLQRDPALCGRC